MEQMEETCSLDPLTYSTILLLNSAPIVSLIPFLVHFFRGSKNSAFGETRKPFRPSKRQLNLLFFLFFSLLPFQRIRFLDFFDRFEFEGRVWRKRGSMKIFRCNLTMSGKFELSQSGSTSLAA